MNCAICSKGIGDSPNFAYAYIPTNDDIVSMSVDGIARHFCGRCWRSALDTTAPMMHLEYAAKWEDYEPGSYVSWGHRLAAMDVIKSMLALKAVAEPPR